MSCENCEESAYVIDKLAKLLAEIAVIVNGPEPPLTRWSYHDLPEKVRALRQAQQPAAAVPATAAECDFIGSFLDLFEDSEPNALIAKRALAKIKAALAQQPAAAVPEGYALVPVEPTEAMLDEGGKWTDAYAVWAAMLAAALAERVEVGRE